MKRKTMGNKLRFEVFKRDLFKCQYCGGSSPEVVLNVDHIKPVSKGGSDDIENLVTSCLECNSGKSDRELSDFSVVEKSRAQLEISQEKINQIKMIGEWAAGLKSEGDQVFETLNEYVFLCTRTRFKSECKSRVVSLCKKFGLKTAILSVDKALEYVGENPLSIKDLTNACKILSEPESVSKAKFCRAIYKNRFGLPFNDYALIEEKTSIMIESLGVERAISIFKGCPEETVNMMIGVECV